MKLANRKQRVVFGLAAALLLALPFVFALTRADGDLDNDEGERSRDNSAVLADVIASSGPAPVALPAAQPSGFAPQTRMGYTAGDQWEPAIATDRFAHVYILYPQYQGVPGCPDCHSPTMVLLLSADHGATWSAPRIMYPAGQTTGQWDAQLVVDPVDGRTVYASWLQNGKSDTVVAKSVDFGATWSVVVADHSNAGTDKPILVVRGPNVYVAYDHSQKIYVSASHDGGATFTAVNLNKTGKLGWALAGGGTIDPAGNVYFGWAGYEQNGGAKGAVNLFISRSTDGGATWTNISLDTSGAPPDCSTYQCGWAFLGPQAALASDAAGNIYALWNAGASDGAPERIYFAKSTNHGATWSSKVTVSSAPNGTSHAFPALAAGAAGDVRVSWMDARDGLLWNTYYRHSTNGGANWSAETRLSTPVSGYSYIQPGGFSFPFGDYYEMELDYQGLVHVVWGEGLNYSGPGSIWYTRGN